MSLNRYHLTHLIEAEGGKNWWTPELFASYIKPLLPPELRIVAPPPAYEENYNCFVYAFGLHNDPEFLGGENPLQPEFVWWLVRAGVLVEKDHAIVGCIVLYMDVTGEITHAGIMQDVHTVISKWMWGPTIVHALMDVPASFGDQAQFFIVSDPACIKQKYLEYKATGVEIQPIT
jgi:hypothetical protein